MADTDIKIEIKAIDNASRALKNIEKQLSPIRKKVGNVDKEFDKVDKSIGRASKSFSGFKGLLAGAITVGGITAFKNSVIAASSRAEDLKTTLETVTGSAQEGDKAFKFINDFATRTPFDIETLTETFIKLKAAGIEPTEQLLTQFGDMAAVTTDRIGSLNAITDLFSRTTAGGLGLEDLNRLADRGIPVFDIFQEKLGLTRLEVSEFGKTAEGAAKLKDALLEGLDERFGGGMEKASQNLSVSLSNLGIAANNALIKVGEGGLSDAINTAAQTFSQFIVANEDLALVLGEKLGQAVTAVSNGIIFLFENADKAKPIFELLGLVFNDIVVPAATILFDILVKVAEALKPLIETAIPVAKTLFEGLASVMTDFVIPAFNTVVETIKTVIGVVGDMIDKITYGIEKLGEITQAGKDLASAGWNKAKDAVGGAGEAITDFGAGVADTVGDGLSNAGNSIKDFANDGLYWLGWLEDEAVGNSIVPDMVNSIGDWMGRLQDILANPVAIGVDKSLDSMSVMADMADRLGMAFDNAGDRATIMADKLGVLNAMSSLSTSGNLMGDLDRMADRGIPVYDQLQKQLGLSRLDVSEFSKTDEGSKAIRRVASSMNNNTPTSLTSNTNFNISGVTVNNGDRMDSPEARQYIEGVATRIAYKVLRQNTSIGGLI